MAFENLAVRRLILHEVYRRKDDRQMVPPRYGGQLLQLSASALDVFKERVVEALGNNSQSMQMDIVDSQLGSAVEISSSLIDESDSSYVIASQRFADKLATVQTARNLPGGILVVFDGTVGPSPHSFVGVIKAETQSGFGREYRSGAIQAQYFENLFLTPAAKLYKIGMFVRESTGGQTLPQDWKAFVYDRLMANGNRERAARYFFSGYLGCEFPKNSALLTKLFFDNTRQFIRNLDVAPEKRADLLTSLYTYLKVDKAPTIEISTFSNSYIPVEKRDEYRTFMQVRKFPLTAVQKDISELKSVLKLRKLAFKSNIRLTAPPEAFRDLISIETIPVEGVASGQPSEWTRIIVRDQIRDP